MARPSFVSVLVFLAPLTLIQFGSSSSDKKSFYDLLSLEINEESVSYPPLIQRRLFNTSYATVVSLFSFSLPRQTTHTETELDLANQAILGIFALVVGVVFLALPAIFTAVRTPDSTERSLKVGEWNFNFGSAARRRSAAMQRLMESPKILNFMRATSDLSNKIGLDPVNCVQRAVCQSHRAPENQKFGIFAIPLQLIFPSLEEDSQLSSFSKAAWTGKYSKSARGEEYRCFFDLLGLCKYLVDWMVHAQANKPEV